MKSPTGQDQRRWGTYVGSHQRTCGPCDVCDPEASFVVDHYIKPRSTGYNSHCQLLSNLRQRRHSRRRKCSPSLAISLTKSALMYSYVDSYRYKTSPKTWPGGTWYYLNTFTVLGRWSGWWFLWYVDSYNILYNERVEVWLDSVLSQTTGFWRHRGIIESQPPRQPQRTITLKSHKHLSLFQNLSLSHDCVGAP